MTIPIQDDNSCPCKRKKKKEINNSQENLLFKKKVIATSWQQYSCCYGIWCCQSQHAWKRSSVQYYQMFQIHDLHGTHTVQQFDTSKMHWHAKRTRVNAQMTHIQNLSRKHNFLFYLSRWCDLEIWWRSLKLVWTCKAQWRLSSCKVRKTSLSLKESQRKRQCFKFMQSGNAYNGKFHFLYL